MTGNPDIVQRAADDLTAVITRYRAGGATAVTAHLAGADVDRLIALLFAAVILLADDEIADAVGRIAVRRTA